MSSADWVAQAAAAFSAFHRAALALGFIAVVVLVIRHWRQLSSPSGPVGHIVAGSLSAFAIPEALFPLYWIIVRGRPVSDITPQFLSIYIYIGAALVILTALIGVRQAWKG